MSLDSRAQLKRDLKLGWIQIERILAYPPDYVATAKVLDILRATPKFGHVKAARFLRLCRISQSKTIGGLSERQRAELIELFVGGPTAVEILLSLQGGV